MDANEFQPSERRRREQYLHLWETWNFRQAPFRIILFSQPTFADIVSVGKGSMTFLILVP